MNVIMLPGGVLRVPDATVVDGIRVDGTRDVYPADADYGEWLPFAVAENQALTQQAEEADRDQMILARWRERMTA
jgi:hypothetical protein